MTSTIIVFGGSGFIGTQLLRRLIKTTGINVISADIMPPREHLPDVEYRIADVRDLQHFDVPAGTSTIFNLAAIHTTPGHEPWEYYDTNIRGAIAVNELASRNEINEIVFTSSISVYGPGEDTKTEDSPTAPISDYGRSKRLAEEIHCRWAETKITRRIVIARPAVVFGRGERGNFTRMAKLLRRGFFVFPGRRDTVKACIYVEDLIDAIELARARPEKRILFNAAFAQRYTIEDIVETFKAIYFPRAVTFTMPRVIVDLAVRLLGMLGGRRFGFHPDRVTKLVRSTDIHPDWLCDQGWSPDDPLRNALKRWSDLTGGRFE